MANDAVHVTANIKTFWTLYLWFNNQRTPVLLPPTMHRHPNNNTTKFFLFFLYFFQHFQSNTDKIFHMPANIQDQSGVLANITIPRATLLNSSIQLKSQVKMQPQQTVQQTSSIILFWYKLWWLCLQSVFFLCELSCTDQIYVHESNLLSAFYSI